MTAPIRLYGSWTTNPQKVRLALEALELPYEWLEVDLLAGEHRRPEFGEITPLRTVPVLDIDGVRLRQSGTILAYLGEREGRLWPTTTAGRAQAMDLLFIESSGFQLHAGAVFLNRAILPRIGKEGDPTRVAKAHKKMAPILQLLSDTLGDADYLLGAFSVVDCAFGPWLPWLDLDGYPTLSAWRARLEARPEWSRCGVAGPN